MLTIRQSRFAALGLKVIMAILVVAGSSPGLALHEAWAQATPVELVRTDITKLKTLDSSQWAAMSVRLGDSKDAALRTLQRTSNIKVQEDSASGRLSVYAPPTSNTLVMSVKITQNQVTAINLFGGFSEWMQGDTRLLFRAFEDDSLRHKLLGREDQREVVRGGTKEAPTVNVTYAYFKEGILLHYAVGRSADGKQVETLREMVLIYPAKPR